jgi:Mn-dependent DtxR family transcriptional regulator
MTDLTPFTVSLSKRQLSILLYIATYQHRYRRAPTQPEIATKHHVSMGTACREIGLLQALGYVVKEQHGFRKLRLTGKELT